MVVRKYRPTGEEMERMYVTEMRSFSQMGKAYGVSGTSIFRWLRAYGIVRVGDDGAVISGWRQAKRAKAKMFAHLRKRGIVGPVTCPDCRQVRVVKHDASSNMLCRKCSNVRSANDPQWISRNLAILTARNSSEKMRDLHRGERNNRWKGGITAENVQLRNSPEARAWTKAVLQRDGYKCKICGDAASGNLVAHHIKPWAERKDLRFDVDNGITLCGGRRNNTGCHIQIVHRGSWQNAPMTIEEIRELQSMPVSIDWREAA